ncbi:NUDIX hydrolase [Labedaea rhizosphaerae]|uniref:ADP-ribose pyrophosphatase YjhB (NUDIX family) n=1 Tax=Labedaea rhizosphaerae TaxID=598644 RepID=A0A4R6SJZ2_LABRH|nr:NUDIX domain-containing protein [Labedaea rhizosphaerae]TDQ04666.1 ADP-ribose pyrophosphatase YjhB (NUDIX family) [Labedaea rhizosphaerae]
MPEETPKHSVSVAGIVVDDQDRVLVIKRRDNGHWEPPGGVLELGETFEEGVKREVLEETGVHVEVQRLTGVYKNMKRGIVALVFRCRALVSNDATQTNEATRVRWILPSVVVDLMDEAYSIRILDAFGENIPVRVHDGTSLIKSRQHSGDGSLGSEK